MKAEETIHLLKLHLACISRQHTPDCKRECDNCELCVRKGKTMEALETGIKVIEWLEQKRKEQKK